MAIDIIIPFADSGDLTVIPQAIQVDGSVSFDQGWGAFYALNPATEVNAKRLSRTNYNYLFNTLFVNQKESVKQGVSNHIVGKEYDTNDKVRGTDGENYISLEDTNTDTPPSAKWGLDTSLSIASTAEAQAGTNNTKAITPLRMREGFNAAGSAPVYATRAWVKFNGTGVVAINASGNISSVTDIGVGRYRPNFIIPIEDIDYEASLMATPKVGNRSVLIGLNADNTTYAAPTVNNQTFTIADTANAVLDSTEIYYSIRR